MIRDIAVAALDIDPGVFSTTEQSAKTAKGSIAGGGGSVTKTVQTPPVELTRWTAFVGVARLGGDAILRIGALTHEEARDSVLHTLHWTLDRCTQPPVRHDEDHVEQWTNELADASLGWPQHVASYLSGTWRALAGAERLDLGDVRNLEAALDRGAALCRDYYEGRIDASQTDPAVILAAHGALSASGDAFVRVCAVIEEAVDRLPSARRALHHRSHPDGTLECYAKMLKAGVIEERDGERLGVPIPSMTKYLEDVVARRQEAES